MIRNMKRPLGVTIIGVLMLLQGLPFGFLAVTAIAKQFDALPVIIPPDVASQVELVVPSGLLAGVIWGGLGVLLLLGGIGMLLLRPWAWLLAMVVQGVTLANLLFGYSVGHENYADMVLSVVVVFYLNSRSVRLAFDLARRRARGARGAKEPERSGGTTALPQTPSAQTPSANGIPNPPSRRRQPSHAKDATV